MKETTTVNRMDCFWLAERTKGRGKVITCLVMPGLKTAPCVKMLGEPGFRKEINCNDYKKPRRKG